MIDENSECLLEILTKHVNKIKGSLIAAYQNGDLEEQFKTGTQYDGNGKVKACLSFQNQPDNTEECIDLSLTLANTQQGVVFSAELAWSDGKTIEDVIVCEVCPDCLEDLCECVDSLVGRIQTKLVERMIELVGNFYQS